MMISAGRHVVYFKAAVAVYLRQPKTDITATVFWQDIPKPNATQDISVRKAEENTVNIR